MFRICVGNPDTQNWDFPHEIELIRFGRFGKRGDCVLEDVDLFGGFDRCGHRAFAVRHSPVGTIRFDLLLSVFGLLLVRRVDDNAFLAVNFTRHVVRFSVIVSENIHQHFDDVVVRMRVIIKKNDVVSRNEFDDILGFRIDIGQHGSFFQHCEINKKK